MTILGLDPKTGEFEKLFYYADLLDLLSQELFSRVK